MCYGVLLGRTVLFSPETSWLGMDVGPGQVLKLMKYQAEEDVSGMGAWGPPQGLGEERTRRLRVS